jgi:hypothetical protein
MIVVWGNQTTLENFWDDRLFLFIRQFKETVLA